MFKFNKNNRVGTKLQDGAAAHASDHQHWSRRQFLSGSSMMAAGGLIFGSSPLLSWASPLLTSLYENPDNDRVLILIRLNGGNDGLNTIVPFGTNYRRERYECLRGTLQIDPNDLNSLVDEGNNTPEFALPNWAEGMHNMWNDGNMAVIHNVGYANSNRSHFAGSDLWASGANNSSQPFDERSRTGWMGRYFNQTLPAFLSAPPTIPPAIQIGVSNNLIFRGNKGTPYDLVFSDLEAFDDLIQSGELYNTGMYGDETCARDIERTFVRRVANNAFHYAGAVKTAYQKASRRHEDCYDKNNGLADQLKIVSRLIKGGLKTKIYMVSLGGFDTHNAQYNTHRALIQTLSDAVNAIQNDLTLNGHSKRVLMMTFSEFGRTVTQNGTSETSGTDHGTLAPIMLFGDAVKGQNFYGTPINLDTKKIDKFGLVHFKSTTYNNSAGDPISVTGQEGAIDFRSVYEKVLRDWLCADAQTVDNVLTSPHPDIADNYEDCSNPELLPGLDPPVPALSQCNPQESPAPIPTDYCDDPLGGMIKGGCNSTVSQSSTLDAYIASLVAFGYNIKEGDSNIIEFKYAIKTTANVKLEILDNEQPVTLEPIIEKYHEAGSYTYEFFTKDGEGNDILTSGSKYKCRLAVNGMVVERTLVFH